MSLLHLDWRLQETLFPSPRPKGSGLVSSCPCQESVLIALWRVTILLCVLTHGPGELAWEEIFFCVALSFQIFPDDKNHETILGANNEKKVNIIQRSRPNALHVSRNSLDIEWAVSSAHSEKRKVGREKFLPCYRLYVFQRFLCSTIQSMVMFKWQVSARYWG